jgi:hypothetical protein
VWALSMADFKEVSMEKDLIVFHSFQHSGSFLSNHVCKCNVLEADSE